MKRKMSTVVSASVFPLLASLLFVGCGSKNNAAPVEDQTPITLSIYTNSDLTPDILDLVQKKFPYITFTIVTPGKGSQLTDLVAQNNVPDILENPAYSISQWNDLGLTTDLTPFVNKYKVDLSRYNAQYIENIHSWSPNGGLDALPFYQWVDILFYNKDLFDKFGVPYPKDGMTWPELLDIARKMTRNDGGTQYYGFWLRNYRVVAGEYPLLALDNQDKATVTNDKWTKYMEFVKSIYEIPGSSPSLGDHSFLKDKTLATWPIGAEHSNLELKDATANGLNWDMVNLPTFPDAPGQASYANGITFGISATSQHKDQAFKVISYLGSDEVQDALSADGMPPVITNPAVLHDFGKNNPNMKGKNVNAIIYKKFATVPRDTSKYDNYAYGKLDPHEKDIINGKKDINTALKEAEQDINQYIDSLKQGK